MKLLILFIVLAFIGCGPTVVYEKEFDVGEEWSYSEEMPFEIAIDDTTMVYDLMFIIEHSSSYPNQNLYINISTQYPDNHIVTDQVSLQVANSRGEYNGSCSGNSCRLPIALQERFRFKQIGLHKIIINQYSRKDKLPEVYKGKLQLIQSKT